LLLSVKSFATNYHVGPGQAYTDLGDVPWITLTAGDTVSIHWRSTPYAEKIFLRAQGTETDPVVIRGVPNVDDLIVRHCKIHDNAQAIFTNSNGATEGEISRNTLIEYNEIWGNGNADSDGTEHNIYIQSAGTIIQYNYFGSPRAGSVGANIKDRSSGTIIRYNWIEGAARILDLVETEDAAPIIMNEPDYHDVYVYGNIITNYLTSDPFGSNLIHYGFDNSPVEAKRGTLYFYNNTVYIEGDEDDWWNIRLFDVPDDQDPTTTEGTVALYNNIIHKSGTTHLQMMRDGGTIEYNANNWIVSGYEDLGYGATATVITNTPPIIGANPGFNDIGNEDFTLMPNSACIDIAGDLPASVTANYPLDKQYVKHADVISRTEVGEINCYPQRFERHQ